MAVGEIIGAAIGILMLIIVAYLVVGNTLSTAEMVVNTQKEMTLLKEIQLNTRIEIMDAHSHLLSTWPYYVYRVDVRVKNTGTEPVWDFFNQTDVFITNASASPHYFLFNNTGVGTGGSYYLRNWSYTTITFWDLTTENRLPETTHPGMWDPGESLEVIRINFFRWDPQNSQVTVVTSNGAQASDTIYAIDY
jgi:flagellar protein FlaF